MTVEEAKFYPAPLAEPAPPGSPDIELGELPASYGKSRLVLVPVDPYLLYVYWDLASEPPAGEGARAVLRLHEGARPFDIEVDIAAGKWYVHLWSPNKAYQADLGIREEDGTFVALAHSNTVQTPPSSPAPRAEKPATPQPETPAETPYEPVSQAPPGAGIAAEAELPAELPAEPVAVQEKPARPPQVDLAKLLERKIAALFAVQPDLPIPYSVTDFGMPETDPGFADADFSLSDPSEFGLNEFAPGEFEIAPPFQLADLEELDLTEYSEERFSPGISSGESQPRGGTLGE